MRYEATVFMPLIFVWLIRLHLIPQMIEIALNENNTKAIILKPETKIKN